ncbi:unnamed protein product [Menidia menidia]|uniref:(Atlantic silverside) hypothetical protein n=1 Tax=Menidia menidia TaxID=238744 RepID=A0A8S4BRX6_9TELE|nr:unnamed protein product [Menidia menidia]
MYSHHPFFFSQFFCTVFADISARVLTTASTDDQPALSPRHYQHTDPDSGAQLLCDKCPAGTYVHAHCSPTAMRECGPCPAETFTRRENGVQQCHRCRPPCAAGLVEKAPCTATQDRLCACPPDAYRSGAGGGQCKPHSPCPPGTRVKKRGSQTEDAVCKPCTKGTFSEKASSNVRCRNHTNCQDLGLVLLIPGTREKDNVCGLSSATPVSQLDPVEAVLAQESLISSTSSSLGGSVFKGPFSQSATTQMREITGGEDHRAMFSHADVSNPNPDPPWTQLPPAPGQPADQEQHLEQPDSETVPGVGNQAADLEAAEVVRVGTGITKVAGQGSAAGVSCFYRPTRRGSPRLSTHDRFDINEHLPWMIVLLLLLVLVVIVVCSVKRSSRVLKKGPVQDPSSIVEKAIQKKPPAPPTQVREKWIYYSNGQG